MTEVVRGGRSFAGFGLGTRGVQRVGQENAKFSLLQSAGVSWVCFLEQISSPQVKFFVCE
jgi:hypothetical protein